MSGNRKAIGQAGEREARRRLSLDGYSVIDVNWRCRSGEIDIVAEKDGRLVFVEVRTRSVSSLSRFGSAAESVDYRKMQKVRGAALVYMRQKGRLEAAIRFDVIAIALQAGTGAGSGTSVSGRALDPYTVIEYRHYEAAF